MMADKSVLSMATSTGSSRALLSNWLALEVQTMMHGLGDCNKPLFESAILIEDIVHQQIALLLTEAADVSSQRNSRFIGIEDLIFLLRKDKVKLRRLLRYLQLKDQKMSVEKTLSEEDVELVEGDRLTQPSRKRINTAREFLTIIDGTGELLALINDQGVDEFKHERMLRADLQSRTLDTQQYIEFCESRQTTFNKKSKFREWMMWGLNLEIKPNALTVEIMAYFTYEIIAQIIDLTLLVKQDRCARTDDPICQLLPPVTRNHPDLKQSRFMVTDAAPNTNMQSPPLTPTLGAGQGAVMSLNQSANSTANVVMGGKVKAKKRKKSGPTQCVLEPAVIRAIQPAEIHEAFRRYQQTIAPFSTTMKLARQPNHHWLLCC